MAHKAKTIKTLQKGILGQMKHHAVEVRTGHAVLQGPGRVSLDGKEISTEKILIATGGRAITPPIPGAENNPAVVGSREVLQLEKLPKRLVIVGGGYIGMEFASYFAAVGTAVTVVEMTPEIIPMLETATAQSLRKQVPGVEYRLSSRVTRIAAASGGGAVVTIEPTGGTTGAGDTPGASKPGTPEEIEGDLVLLSAGRAPNVEGSGFAEAGLDFDRSGVKVDEFMRTNLPGVYAAGDVTGRMLLAHAAYRMGEVAVAHMFGAPASPAQRMRYHAIPWVVFTMPEVAGCGLNPGRRRSGDGTPPRGSDARQRRR